MYNIRNRTMDKCVFLRKKGAMSKVFLCNCHTINPTLTQLQRVSVHNRSSLQNDGKPSLSRAVTGP